MRRRTLCALLALALCLILTACSGKAALSFDLKTLKDGAVYPGALLGASREEVVKAGVPLESEPESESDFGGKKSQTYKLKAASGKATVNGEKLREAGFQFLDGELLNCSLYLLDSRAEPLVKQLDGLYGEHAERDSVQENTTILTWTLEANGHAIQIGLVQVTQGDAAYCSSIQATATDLLPASSDD